MYLFNTALAALAVEFWSKRYWIEFFRTGGGTGGLIALFVISFTESCCFIIPPDIILPFICAGKSLETALFYGGFATAASVIGAAFGYLIGIKGGRPLMLRLFNKEKTEKVEDYFNRYDAWAIAIAAFTPIPYKVFTIAGGVFRIRFWKFIVVSIIFRGIRYMIWSLLGWRFGEKAMEIIENIDKYMAYVIAVAAALAAWYVVTRVLKARRAKKA